MREAESAPPDGKAGPGTRTSVGVRRRRTRWEAGVGVGGGGVGQEAGRVMKIAGTNRNLGALGVLAKALGETYF